jgi:hypothetical protein
MDNGNETTIHHGLQCMMNYKDIIHNRKGDNVKAIVRKGDKEKMC